MNKATAMVLNFETRVVSAIRTCTIRLLSDSLAVKIENIQFAVGQIVGGRREGDAGTVFLPENTR
jgi:hypothetical protein